MAKGKNFEFCKLAKEKSSEICRLTGGKGDVQLIDWLEGVGVEKGNEEICQLVARGEKMQNLLIDCCNPPPPLKINLSIMEKIMKLPFSRTE